MILGDSSAWVDHLRDHPSRAARRVRELLGEPELVTTDVVVMEVLAGARDDAAHRQLQRALASHRHVPAAPADFESAAAIYRRCRRNGVTPRSLLDCLVAATAIRVDAAVLHNDRDFDVIARHVELRIDAP